MARAKVIGKTLVISGIVSLAWYSAVYLAELLLFSLVLYARHVTFADLALPAAAALLAFVLCFAIFLTQHIETEDVLAACFQAAAEDEDKWLQATVAMAVSMTLVTAVIFSLVTIQSDMSAFEASAFFAAGVLSVLLLGGLNIWAWKPK